MRLAGFQFIDLPVPHECDCRHLGEADLAPLQDFYRVGYPGNWFEPRLLATGKFAGPFMNSTLVSAAGIHVYSRRYGVAALGNISTLPGLRGRGLATAVTAWLCRDLIQSAANIVLNVQSDLASAIACYKKLGFEFHADYEEFMAEKLENHT
jgi:predicted GNAT family acetyltransferase